MVAWVLASAGVVAAAYFAGIVLCKIDTEWTFGSRLPKKIVRIFTCSIIAIEGLVFVSIDPDVRGSAGAIWLVAAAAAVVAFFAPSPVAVTPNGLSRAQYLRRDRFIRWDEIDHYEILKGTFGVLDVYYFRTHDGRTLIRVNDGVQDGALLLREISQYKRLERQPFHRHWYDGTG